MALPTGDLEWPPPGVKREIDRVAELSGWYGGKPEVVRPKTVILQDRRWWQLSTLPTGGGANGWGEPEPIHVPTAADLARTSADLMFTDEPEVTTTDRSALERWEVMEDEIGWEAMLLEASELAAALSGTYWRVTFDRETEPRWPIPTFVNPDNAWPEWRWGRLSAVTFFRVVPPPPNGSDKLVWRHLERHSVTVGATGTPTAIVEHGLYAGKVERLGVRQPLTDHPETEPIARSLTSEDMIVMPGVTRTAGYVPNMLPNRLDVGSRLGRPDIEQLEPMLQAVDNTWTSWLRDLDLGKGRIIVPDEYLGIGVPGQGATFNVDRAIYSPLRMMAPSGTDPAAALRIVQFAIRVAEHERTMRAAVQQIVTSAGYNLFSFGMADASAPSATATEVDARTDLSLVTKRKKARYWKPALRDLVSAMLTMDYFLRYPGAVPVDPSTINVELEQEIAPKPKELAETANLMAQAKAASTQTLVQLVHPEWGMDEVLAETKRIMNESGVPMQDPQALGGAASGSPVDALLSQMGMNGTMPPAQMVGAED